MRIRAALFCVFLLSACGEESEHLPFPGEPDLVKLETKLSRHPCVGNLDDWERTYRFKHKPGTLMSGSTDFGVIEFHFRRAGTITLTPGRKAVSPDDSENWPDSPAVKVLEGNYNIRSGTLSVQRCQRVR
jgi:hypothetical protein